MRIELGWIIKFLLGLAIGKTIEDAFKSGVDEVFQPVGRVQIQDAIYDYGIYLKKRI